jgi:hypothetical protein
LTRRLPIWAAALFAVSCSSKFQQKLFLPPDLEINAIAVYPFGFRWPEGAYRSFELSQKLIEVALDRVGDDALLFGPSEFRVYRPQDDNAWAASNLVSLFPAYHLSAHKAAVLRPWAEQRRFQSQREVSDAKGKHLGMKTVVEITYVGHVEVILPSTQQMLVEETGEITVDPFVDHTDDPDPAPELSTLMKGLTTEALRALSDNLKPPSKPVSFGVKYEFVPEEAFSYQEEGRPALEKELAKVDAVEADVIRVARVRYANPKASDPETAKLVKLPGGLYVTSSSSDFKARPGDLIHLIDSRPALPQALQRVRFSATPVTVRIRRITGISQETTLP